jgi:hypothetical protein
MDALVIAFGGLATIVGFFSAALRSKHPYESLWVGGVSAIFVVLAVCAGIHAKWKAGEATAAAPASPPKLAKSQWPWVIIDQPVITLPKPNENLFCKILIKNTGPTPARGIRAKITSGVHKAEREFTQMVKEVAAVQTVDEAPLILAPGQDTTLCVDIHHRIDGELLAKIESRKSVLWIFCELTYVDIDDTPHKSWSSFWYHPAQNSMYMDQRYHGME